MQRFKRRFGIYAQIESREMPDDFSPEFSDDNDHARAGRYSIALGLYSSAIYAKALSPTVYLQLTLELE